MCQRGGPERLAAGDRSALCLVPQAIIVRVPPQEWQRLSQPANGERVTEVLAVTGPHAGDDHEYQVEQHQ